MLGISDGYARYYSAKAYSERVGLANGRLMGIGVSVVKDPSSGYARIIRVYDNTPTGNRIVEHVHGYGHGHGKGHGHCNQRDGCGHTKTDFFAHSENVLPCVKVVRCCRIKAVP